MLKTEGNTASPTKTCTLGLGDLAVRKIEKATVTLEHSCVGQHTIRWAEVISATVAGELCQLEPGVANLQQVGVAARAGRRPRPSARRPAAPLSLPRAAPHRLLARAAQFPTVSSHPLHPLHPQFPTVSFSSGGDPVRLSGGQIEVLQRLMIAACVTAAGFETASCGKHLPNVGGHNT